MIPQWRERRRLLGAASGVMAFDCDTAQARIDLEELFDGFIPVTPEWELKRGGQLLRYDGR